MTRQRVPSCAAAIALALTCATTQARVTEFVVESETPLEAGTSYGAVGPYVRLRGHVVGELDPALPGNVGIVNLSNAPRNANGMVEYRADVEIHMPADAARGNGAALYEVVNRGNRLFRASSTTRRPC